MKKVTKVYYYTTRGGENEDGECFVSSMGDIMRGRRRGRKASDADDDGTHNM